MKTTAHAARLLLILTHATIGGRQCVTFDVYSTCRRIVAGGVVYADNGQSFSHERTLLHPGMTRAQEASRNNDYDAPVRPEGTDTWDHAHRLAIVAADRLAYCPALC